MSNDNSKVPMQATPHGTLLEQIIDPCQPKNEREWAASREIERLKAELNDAEATVGLSGAECERHIQEVDASREAIERLEAINEVNADTLNAMQVEIEQRDAVIERQSAALRQVLTILEEEYVMPDEIETAIITIKEAL